MTGYGQDNRVGYVPDQPYLYDKLSGRELLHFVGRMYGLSEDEVADRIDKMIADSVSPSLRWATATPTKNEYHAKPDAKPTYDKDEEPF